MSKTTAIKWFRRFNSAETSFEDQPMSGSPPSTMNIDEALRKLVEQQPQTSNRRLSAQLGSSKSTIARRHLNKIGLVKRCSTEEFLTN